jgi:hypothetical protein
MIASEQALAKVAGRSQDSDAADIAQIGTAGATKDSLAMQVYLEALKRNRAVLSGSAVALLVLAIGAFSETRNLPNLRGIIIAAAVATLFLAVGAACLSVSEGRRAHKLCGAVATKARP